MNVIFMGSGEFALHPLRALKSSEHKVQAVFTAHKDAALNPVYSFASCNEIPVFAPKSLKASDDLELIRQIPADIIVVASYGKILSRQVLESKKYGSVNIHPSMLPRFRGASPIQSTILAGDKESAVCIIRMDEGVDTGPILLARNFNVPSKVHFTDLERFCSTLGGRLIVQALDNFFTLKERSQEEVGVKASYAVKIQKNSGKIIWSHHAEKIERMIRAFSKWPTCFFVHKGETIKISDADYEQRDHGAIPGTVLSDQCLIACGFGALRPNRLQRAGRKLLTTAEFLRGYKIAKGELLE
jgi:methionyl-tRNA formyltransferase